jgi:hypothetical protein
MGVVIFTVVWSDEEVVTTTVVGTVGAVFDSGNLFAEVFANVADVVTVSVGVNTRTETIEERTEAVVDGVWVDIPVLGLVVPVEVVGSRRAIDSEVSLEVEFGRIVVVRVKTDTTVTGVGAFVTVSDAPFLNGSTTMLYGKNS